MPDEAEQGAVITVPGTPPKNPEAVPPIQSTPHNKGSSMSREYRLTTHEAHMAQPLLEDLANFQSCTIQNLLVALLSLLTEEPSVKQASANVDMILQQAINFCNIPSDSPSHGTNKSKRHEDHVEKKRQQAAIEMRASLRAYCTAKPKNGSIEFARYEPLKNTLNAISRGFRFSNAELQLEDPLRRCEYTNVLFHINDPQVIKNNFNDMLASERKPDIILADLEVTNKIHGDEYFYDPWEDSTRITNTENSEAPEWCNVLNCLELKVYQKEISTEPLKNAYGDRLKDVRPHPTQVDPKAQEEESGYANLEPQDEGQDKPSSGARSSPRPVPVTRRSSRMKVDEPTAKSTTSQGLKRSGSHLRVPESKRAATDGDIPAKKLRASTQLALYAIERLNSAPGMTHTMGWHVRDNIIYVWWFDRQGGIQSSGLDFIENLPYLVALIIILQRFRSRQWGEHGSLFPRVGTPSIAIEGRVFQPNVATRRHYSHSYSLIGRGTTTVQVVDTSQPSEQLFLKISWPEETRVNEREIVRRAALLAHEQLADEHFMVTEHLPNVLCSSDLTSTRHIRELLGLSTTGARVQRLIVSTYLRPLTNLKGAVFWEGYWQLIRCHALLWYLGIQHGDISVTNLMYNATSKKAILNDYDLARLRDSATPSGFDRTGTMPFMAVDLLTDDGWNGKIPRLYKHDLESFCWVLIWVLHCFRDGKQRIVLPCDRLVDANYATCRATKYSILFDSSVKVEATSDYAELTLPCQAMIFYLGENIRSQQASVLWHRANQETLDGVAILRGLLEDLHRMAQQRKCADIPIDMTKVLNLNF